MHYDKPVSLVLRGQRIVLRVIKVALEDCTVDDACRRIMMRGTSTVWERNIQSMVFPDLMGLVPANPPWCKLEPDECWCEEIDVSVRAQELRI